MLVILLVHRQSIQPALVPHLQLPEHQSVWVVERCHFLAAQ